MPPLIRRLGLRPDDLLVLQFSLYDFELAPGTATSPPRVTATDHSRIDVGFAPQHVLEEAFFEASTPLKFEFSIPIDPPMGSDEAEAQAALNAIFAAAATVDDFDFPAGLARLIERQTGVSIPGTPGTAKVTPVAAGAIDVSVPPSQDAYRFVQTASPPQRPSYTLTPPAEGVTGQAARARISGFSVLVFDASNLGTFSLTLEALLDKLHFRELRLAPAALPGPDEQVPASDPDSYAIRKPEEGETSIEAPYHLILSPTPSGRWDHSGRLLGGASGHVELWHTRLGILPIAPAGAPADRYTFRDDAAFVRAIWALDPEFAGLTNNEAANQVVQHTLEPFRASLDVADRYNLVHLTANYRLVDRFNNLVTAAVAARRLMLSALGAWLDLAGDWRVIDLAADIGLGLSVSQWRHRATMGRDHYVRVVYEGFLYPFGHRAALIKVTERKLVPVAGVNIAYLRQRMYILVREPERAFGPEAAGNAKGRHPVFDRDLPLGRTLPFRLVRVLTTATPNLDAPLETITGVGAQSLFWPQCGGEPFLFRLQGVDRENREVDFQAPLLFIALDAHNAGNLASVNYAYNLNNVDPVQLARITPRQEGEWQSNHNLDMRGQGIAYAPREGEPGATLFPTASMRLGAVLRGDFKQLIGARQAAFWPVLESAGVAIPDLQFLSGAGERVEVGYEELYLESGFDEGENPGGIFAKPVSAADPAQDAQVALDFSGAADKAGGVATPNMSIVTLSRKYGPAGGSGKNVADDYFHAETVFPTGKLLGQFPLKDLLAGAGFPKIIRTGIATTYSMKWDTPIVSPGGPDSVLECYPEKTRLTLTVSTDVPDDGSPPLTTIEGKLTSFALRFFERNEFLRLKFASLCFSVHPGRKPEVDAQLEPKAVEFLGDLAWVSRLAEFIPSDGFNDPPAVDVTSEGITAGFSLGLPTITMGVFSLQNLSLGAALLLPFTEIPASLGFHFASREKPCTLSYGPFGGTAFVGLQFNVSGVQMLEMALEFGATLSVNLGVASGSVYAFGGVYFKLEADDCSLFGTFRLGGEMDVLGLISASIELTLSLGYEGGKATGRATIEVEVEVCFFSFTVRVGCERRFAGSDGDPTFRELMAPYYVHALSGQVLYRDGSTDFYLDRFDETRAAIYDGSTYVLEPSAGLALTPIRGDFAPEPSEAELISPWLDYCRAFATM